MGLGWKVVGLGWKVVGLWKCVMVGQKAVYGDGHRAEKGGLSGAALSLNKIKVCKCARGRAGERAGGQANARAGGRASARAGGDLTEDMVGNLSGRAGRRPGRKQLKDACLKTYREDLFQRPFVGTWSEAFRIDLAEHLSVGLAGGSGRMPFGDTSSRTSSKTFRGVLLERLVGDRSGSTGRRPGRRPTGGGPGQEPCGWLLKYFATRISLRISFQRDTHII